MKVAKWGLMFIGVLTLFQCKRDEKIYEEKILPKTIKGIEVIFVEGGVFMMGSPNGIGDEDEQPQHQVEVRDFNISKYEITNIKFAEFLNERGNRIEEGVMWYKENGDAKIKQKGNKYIVERGYENFPVSNVSWYGAKAFANWVGGRLPLEAEWEYAARGGKKSKGFIYAGSNNVDEVSWHRGNADNTIHKVGIKFPNELGIYDMSGNVFEWCFDWHSNYGVSSYIGSHRIIRGGNFSYDATYSRIANRGGALPISASSGIGFRIVFDKID